MHLNLPALLILLAASVAARDLDLLNFNHKGNARNARDFLSFNRRKLDHSDDNYGSGDDDDDNILIPDMSAWCYFGLVATFASGDLEELIDGNQEFIFEDDVVIGYDFGANTTTIEAYEDVCNMLGGRTLSISIEYSDECDISMVRGFPQCVPRAPVCNEADVSSLGKALAEGFEGECTYTAFEIDSGDDDGQEGDDLGPNVSDTCFEDMFKILLVNNIYDIGERDYIGWIVDETTGDFTGNNTALEEFTHYCESADGRIVEISSDNHSDECEDQPYMSSAPGCVSSSCDDGEAELVMNYFLQRYIHVNNATCAGETVSIDDSGPSTTNSSKATKGTKGQKAGKRPHKAPGGSKGGRSSNLRK